jgi:hypothetical protein
MRMPGLMQVVCPSMWLATLFLTGPLRAEEDALPVNSSRVSAALVIGNARYTSLGPLRNPENDADRMCEALARVGFLTTCTKNVPSRALLRSAIEDFVDSLPAGAVSVVYYAGHGLQVKGENYLVPTGAQITDEASMLSQTVSLSFLMDQLQMRHHPGYLTVVILDACRDDPVSGAGTPLPLGLAPMTAAGLPEATDVLYATASRRTAIDGRGRNGTLTQHLLTQLHQHVPLDDLFKRVIVGVQGETVHTQTPEYYGNFTGIYCFGGCEGNVELLREEREAVEAANRRAAEEHRAAEMAQKGEEAARKQQAVAPIIPPTP